MGSSNRYKTSSGGQVGRDFAGERNLRWVRVPPAHRVDRWKLDMQMQGNETRSTGRCWCAGGGKLGPVSLYDVVAKEEPVLLGSGSPFWPFLSSFSLHANQRAHEQLRPYQQKYRPRPLNVRAWHGRTGVRAAATKPYRQSCGGS
jgi:hypothetical protein